MSYIDMVKKAYEKGLDEKAMWRSVEAVSSILDDIKDVHPEEYDCYLRELHEAMHGTHYCEEFAKHDVSKMHHTDMQGKRHNGEYWSSEEIEKTIGNKTFPTGTTKWDRYVAYNAAWHDFANLFDESQVYAIAYAMFFDDEDFCSDGKVWRYMSMAG